MVQSVIVIGAGIIGAATALQLAKAGHKVQIVHAGGTDATSLAFGWINASFFLSDDHHNLRAAGIAAWHRALKDVPAPVDWQGCLCWDMPPDEMAATFTQLKEFDYPVEMLTKPQIKTLEPALTDAPEQALFFPAEGAASSADLARHFLIAAQSLGAKLISNVYVSGLKTQNDQVIGIETPHGDMLADQVIIAAGTGTATIACSIGCDIPLVPRPVYILRTSPQKKTLHHILATPSGEIRQEPSGQILMPVAASHQGDSAERLTQTPTEAADATITRLQDICGGLDDADWSEVIRAERPVPRDGFPIIGPIAKGAYVAVLHSGITLGPIIAELVSKDITGRLDNADAAMLAPYRPDRFLTP
ncbi:glycine/D-amino acid oxidase-like deaminating enzyme [Yoonia maricola]|uniref:Glycine/D-amino acid oxidase-like deaminating enzyme n=1 Tax=Yoonia maricola TaxID=420999 RepID=A0A2M8WJW5_9RHOB|nr:FAD-binding oxidoreductase [Yoonia maricola]PJI91225.1 glycine/D-amino acid oxidase-like deaminating enzyme [Yoonia maricola]